MKYRENLILTVTDVPYDIFIAFCRKQRVRPRVEDGIYTVTRMAFPKFLMRLDCAPMTLEQAVELHNNIPTSFLNREVASYKLSVLEMIERGITEDEIEEHRKMLNILYEGKEITLGPHWRIQPRGEAQIQWLKTKLVGTEAIVEK